MIVSCRSNLIGWIESWSRKWNQNWYNMFQGLLLLLSMLSWLQPRTGLIFQSSNDGLEPGAVWLSLGCYSILPHTSAGGLEVWHPHFREEGAWLWVGKKARWSRSSWCFVCFLRVVSCQVGLLSVFHVKCSLFVHCCYQCSFQYYLFSYLVVSSKLFLPQPIISAFCLSLQCRWEEGAGVPFPNYYKNEET